MPRNRSYEPLGKKTLGFEDGKSESAKDLMKTKFKKLQH